MLMIFQYSVDLNAVSSLLVKAFSELKVDPKNYNLQISVPKVLNQNTQTEFLRILFEKYVKHQSTSIEENYLISCQIILNI